MGAVIIGIGFLIGFLVAICIVENETMTGRDFIASQRGKENLSSSEISEMEAIIHEEGVWDKKVKFRIAREIKHVLVIDKESYVEKLINPKKKEI